MKKPREAEERSPFDLPHHGELIPKGPYYTPQTRTGDPGDFDPEQFGQSGGPGYTPMAQTDLEEDAEEEEREAKKRKASEEDAP